MSHDQEKTGEGRNTLPVNENNQNRALNGLGASVGNLSPTGFDNLGAGADRYCGQYQYGGTMPNVAPAARVQPAAGEADRLWFAAHPSRTTYTRAAYPGEFDGLSYVGPVVVHQVYPGCRERLRCDGITREFCDIGESESYFVFAMIKAARLNNGFVADEEILRIQAEAAERGAQL
ncbi:hypothetical protein HEQ62_01565 [Haematospirillum jordaniae]|uniref:Uncharacterized protein n=1 Tax=Haematospirillum jordaniae TaxID=1549855 RepID=A0A143DGE8_9PROT|nr:hypothetical protein [Haematospirillum jordaniae]AMW35188.1 hypothetical protein AY555_08395 [Haematospirillum jordaniae]NKD46062.1 hypothetical protein [Haematospirillum jordaniae]NKD56416.1 hypothetical protein [Haematospirillum jordaniae]NKD58474.1 hypothetical protein [Haematospirillum jordaniae]NKD66357.1 hypothetical protein [Haematospirillum jordaniae]